MSDALAQLADALENDDEATVIELGTEVANAIESRKQRHGAFQRLALQARKQAGSGDPVQSTATELINQSTVAAQAHAELGLKVSGYLQGGVEGTEVSGVVRAADDAHASFEEQFTDLRATDSVSVGPVVTVLGPDADEIPKGTSPDTTYTLQNIGDADAADVEAAVRSPLSLSVAPSDVGTVGADSSVSVSLDGVAKQAGQYTGSIRARNQTDVDDLTVQFTVHSKGEYLEDASRSLAGLEEQLEAIIDESAGTGNGNSGGKGNGNTDRGLTGVGNKVETARKRVDNLVSRLNGQGKSSDSGINNEIGAVINLLGAVLNHIDVQSGSELSPTEAAQISVSVTNIIDVLSMAQEASK